MPPNKLGYVVMFPACILETISSNLSQENLLRFSTAFLRIPANAWIVPQTRPKLVSATLFGLEFHDHPFIQYNIDLIEKCIIK